MIDPLAFEYVVLCLDILMPLSFTVPWLIFLGLWLTRSLDPAAE